MEYHSNPTNFPDLNPIENILRTHEDYRGKEKTQKSKQFERNYLGSLR